VILAVARNGEIEQQDRLVGLGAEIQGGIADRVGRGIRRRRGQEQDTAHTAL